MTVDYARALYAAGYRTLSHVAHSEQQRIFHALHTHARHATRPSGSKRLHMRAARQLYREARQAEAATNAEELERRHAALAKANIATFAPAPLLRAGARAGAAARAVACAVSRAAARARARGASASVAAGAARVRRLPTRRRLRRRDWRH